jgi:hypothetical protein
MSTTSSNSSQEDDPFFSLSGDGEWYACIGRQGLPEHYVDGYMDAALELAGAVIDRRQYAKRDRLAMPILYNARHAIELSLKYSIDWLYQAGVIVTAPPKNHDIAAQWRLIQSASLGDMDLRQHISDLQPFIDSLSRIDDDGQQLRYAETLNGQKSLRDRYSCNLELVRASLIVLKEILEAMRYRTIDLVNERATGTFTSKCSRLDLMRIAMSLPPRGQWPEPIFAAAKAEVMARFGIGSRSFSQAIDVIEGNREMGSLVGCEFRLAHLTDEHAEAVINEWSKVHPPRKSEDDLVVDLHDWRDWDKMKEGWRALAAASKAILSILPSEEIADLETIFHIGREDAFCEVYDRLLRDTLTRHGNEGDLSCLVRYLLAKTSLLDAMARGVEILGRRRLAERLRGLRPDLMKDAAQ